MVASKAEGIWFFRGRWHVRSHNEDGVIERLQQANGRQRFSRTI